MILVDSSGWIEYLAACSKADRFTPDIEGDQPLVSSAIQVNEIYKVVRCDVSEERAIEAVSALRRTTVELLAESLALDAAQRGEKRHGPVTSTHRTAPRGPSRVRVPLADAQPVVSERHCARGKDGSSVYNTLYDAVAAEE